MKKQTVHLCAFLFCLISSSLACAEDLAPYRRNLRTEEGQQIYIVGPRAPHLFMISRDLYGDDKSWRQIAEWNGVKAPYELSPQQHLIIKKSPTQSESQGNKTLIAAWKKAGRKDIAAKLARLDSQKPRAEAVVLNPTLNAVDNSATVNESNANPGPKSEAKTSPEISPPAVPAGTTPSVAEPQFTAKWVPYPDAKPVTGPGPDAAIAPQISANSEAALDSGASAATPVQSEVWKKNVSGTDSRRSTKIEAKADSENDEPGSETRWSGGLSALASMMRLESNNSVEAAHNVLYSGLNYGVELNGGYRFSSRLKLQAMVEFERLDLRPGSGGTIENSDRSLLKYGLGAEFEFSHSFSLMGAIVYGQEPDIRPIPDGVTIDAIDVPQLVVEGKTRLIAAPKFKTWLVTEARWMAAVHQDGHDLKNGVGLRLGFDFENEISEHGALTYGLFGKYIAQDTSEAVNNERTAELELGWQW